MEPMKPMQPMQGMEPMKPMEPMQPMAQAQPWWPGHLGHPSTSGSQNRMRYAFFPEEYILLVETDGELAAYDTGNHKITGVAQAQSHSQTLAFSSQNGKVDLDALKRVDVPV